ncbi:hypothetical protein LOTGIDRAFT_233427 [Lottia gigantea]|uniref:CARD domain-containing protein n=1 Tax=Lottia gigantea TaxID=225164 RepID=V4A4L4_LOTGI|nr:hypothetical protein LOTGIDRAFT_233427 [Lottia gigantea]ESO91652.1 hypothetical protein LOTGIDRAFT_233427 [Lottia gigantea]
MDRGRIPEKDEAVLTENREELLRSLIPSRIMSYLLQKGVIDYDDQDEIKQEEKRGRRFGAEKILDKIHYSGPDGLDKFIDSLGSAGYSDLTEKLKKYRLR